MSHFSSNQKKVFSEQLQEIMKKRKKENGKKITQQELADAVFVSRETVSRWVTGKSCPLENKDVIARLCDFLKVPPTYFTKSNYSNGWTWMDENTHTDLNSFCEKIADHIGLSLSFTAFLKEQPALADSVIRSSWVDGILQSLSPDVPEIPGNLFQFISSSGIKIYPSEDVLYMLKVIQRDVEEYMTYLFSKYGKVFEQYHRQVREIQEGAENTETTITVSRRGLAEIDAATGAVYPKPPKVIFDDILHGREDLSIEETRMLSLYRSINNDGKNAVYHTLMQERKVHPSEKTKAIRAAVRKAIKDKTPLPPVSEIIPQEQLQPSLDLYEPMSAHRQKGTDYEK